MLNLGDTGLCTRARMYFKVGHVKRCTTTRHAAFAKSDTFSVVCNGMNRTLGCRTTGVNYPFWRVSGNKGQHSNNRGSIGMHGSRCGKSHFLVFVFICKLWCQIWRCKTATVPVTGPLYCTQCRVPPVACTAVRHARHYTLTVMPIFLSESTLQILGHVTTKSIVIITFICASNYTDRQRTPQEA